MTSRPALITGFEPYGGRGSNPACETARALDGRMIDGVRVHGRALPASYAKLRDCVSALLRELDPVVVISLGLWPGEPMIRIERFGLNLADFEIPDNEGAILADQPLGANGPRALRATLPVQRIQATLLAAGIPARLSTSAGTFRAMPVSSASLRPSRPCRAAPYAASCMFPICRRKSRRFSPRCASSACSSCTSVPILPRWTLAQ
jgi:pyroglutamyl-peptidase I